MRGRPEEHPAQTRRHSSMAHPKENLLIIGATGWIGTYIADQILKAKDSFGRIVIFTSSGTAENKPQVLSELKARGAEIIIGDVKSSEDLLNAYKGLSLKPLK